MVLTNGSGPLRSYTVKRGHKHFHVVYILVESIRESLFVEFSYILALTWIGSLLPSPNQHLSRTAVHLTGVTCVHAYYASQQPHFRQIQGFFQKLNFQV